MTTFSTRSMTARKKRSGLPPRCRRMYRCLMDDRAGVRAARRKGLAVTGTIGIPEEAARQGQLDFLDAFARLRQTNFYCLQMIVDRLLAKYAKEKS